METPGFLIGVVVGFVAACLGFALVGALAWAGKSARQASDSIPVTAMPPAPADYELMEANLDAARLAAALEAGVRQGWPLNFVITYALARHHERADKRQVEPSPRLN